MAGIVRLCVMAVEMTLIQSNLQCLTLSTEKKLHECHPNNILSGEMSNWKHGPEFESQADESHSVGWPHWVLSASAMSTNMSQVGYKLFPSF